MVLARITSEQGIAITQELLAGYRYLASRGVPFELVLCNDYPGSYFDAIQARLHALIHETMLDEETARRVFVLRGAQLTQEDHQLLDAAATILVRGEKGSLSDQLEVAHTNLNRTPKAALPKRVDRSLSVPMKKEVTFGPDSVASEIQPGMFWNGFGCFVPGRYQIQSSGQRMTPAPWSNVMANPEFGCVVTESGSGFTWYKNSRENKLTSWSNDPTSDPPSEILYLYDLDAELLWSPLNVLSSTKPRRVEHRHGASSFHVDENDITTTTTLSVDWNEPVKRVLLELRNTLPKNRRLRITLYVETVLGVNREATSMHQHSAIHSRGRALLIQNGFHPDFPFQVVFLATKQAGCRFTGDRSEFLNQFGSYQNPVGAIYRLSNSTGAALDPCLALQCDIELDADETKEIEFFLGAVEDEGKLSSIFDQFVLNDDPPVPLLSSEAEWSKILNTLQIETPNQAMDILFNDWLLYQSIACRFWGRSAFYQSGGAYGFRDQLQDIMAVVYSRPELAREHILRAASRQFDDGSVQHWWHPPLGKGTKTRFSDDFLFLPYVVHHYCSVTDDLSILDEQVPFIESLPLMAHEQERYEHPTKSDDHATLLEHCKRAMKHGMRYGEHGLPLMGCGDWNDGMNRVGEKGKGESVWVAWFQIRIFRDFAVLLERCNGNDEFIHLLREVADNLCTAIDVHAWDGEWYRRAFFDDGTPLGSSDGTECQIDSLTQSWAVISDGPRERSEDGFNAAIARLFDRDRKLLKLFDPPLDRDGRDAGYIQGYIPGVRENGGQYTHAAVWMISAATKLGKGDLAVELFDALNPIHHSESQESALRYRLEPYVVAADVYTHDSLLGRGGWSWYTGSAAWMYRTVLEDILGIQFRGQTLSIQPCVPSSWTRFKFTIIRNDTTWKITVHLTSQRSETSIPFFLDIFEDGGIHEVEIDVANRTPAELQASHP